MVLPEPLPQEWPLEQWFASVIDTVLIDFTHFDLARACRQRMFHEHVVPYALDVLREDRWQANPTTANYLPPCCACRSHTGTLTSPRRASCVPYCRGRTS